MRNLWNWWSIEGRRRVLIAARVPTTFATQLWEQLPPYIRTAVERSAL